MRDRCYKDLLRGNFDAGSVRYDDIAKVQRLCALELARMLPAGLNPRSVLDVGAGTGYMTGVLSVKFPNSGYVLNDLSPAMLAKAQSKFYNRDDIEFCIGDMDYMDFGYHDLVVSNLALQWSGNLAELLCKLSRGAGVFAFTCTIKGTFAEWYDMIGLPNSMHPTVEYLRNAVVTEISVIRIMEFVCVFDDVREFILYVKRLGVGGAGNYDVPPVKIRYVMRNHTGEFRVTYRVALMIARGC